MKITPLECHTFVVFISLNEVHRSSLNGLVVTFAVGLVEVKVKPQHFSSGYCFHDRGVDLLNGRLTLTTDG